MMGEEWVFIRTTLPRQLNGTDNRIHVVGGGFRYGWTPSLSTKRVEDDRRCPIYTDSFFV